VTIFAANAVAQFESLGPLIGGNVKRVAYQTLRRLIRGTNVKNFADAHRDRVTQDGERPGVLVLGDPDAVLVLKDTGCSLRLDAAVATASRAAAGTVKLASDCSLLKISEFR
jgi:hypothetical protein